MITNLKKTFNKNICDFRNSVMNDMSMCGIPFETINRIAIESEDIEDIIHALNGISISNILEIGAYAGFSTIVFRVAFPDAMITSVDPNYVIDADVPTEYQKGIHVKTIFDHMIEKYNIRGIDRYDSYFSCLPQEQSMCFHKSYNENIYDIPIIDEEVLLKNGKYDFIFIDGDHYSKSVYYDLAKCKKLLNSEGIIILHDMEGKWGEEVKSGIERFLECNTNYLFREINNIGIIRGENNENRFATSRK